MNLYGKVLTQIAVPDEYGFMIILYQHVSKTDAPGDASKFMWQVSQSVTSQSLSATIRHRKSAIIVGYQCLAG